MYKFTIITKDDYISSTIRTSLTLYKHELIRGGFSYKFVDELLNELNKAKLKEI